jgi:hypothetical protein
MALARPRLSDSEEAMAKSANALEILRHDHRELQRMFQRFESAGEREQEKLSRQMADALKLHTRIEEQVFYPFIREATDYVELVEEAQAEHTAAKTLVADLESARDGVHRYAVVKVLGEYVGHHIHEEEHKIFRVIEKTGVDLQALGEEMMEQRKRKGGAASSDEAADAPQGHSRAADEGYRARYLTRLSPSAQRAKWISSPDEGEDYAGQTLVTRNPAVIRAWAEERGAKPATVPGEDPENPRVLRLDFPGYAEGLTPVSWETWFRVFEERKLVFLFQQHLKDGRQSNFFQLDAPEREDG